MSRSRRRLASALAVFATLAVLAPAQAPAAYDPVASGTIELLLAKPFAKLLAANHVRVLAAGGAVRRGRTVLLPASGGEVDSKLGLGTVESEATVVFANGRRRLPFRDLTFKAKHAPLYAKVGGSQLKIATAPRLQDRRSGFGTSFTAGPLKLTANVVSRMVKKLRLRGRLRPGQLIGTLKTAVEPATVHLEEEGRVQLAIDPGFKQKLDSLFVSVNPIAPAELGGGDVLSLPIGLESTLAPDASSGTIKLGGSVELLQLGNSQIFWREVWLQPGSDALLAETDVEPSPPHAGKQAQAPLLALSPGAGVATDPTARRIALSGQAVTLTPAAATSLNDAFAESRGVFTAGEAVGVLALEAQAE